MKFDSYSNRVSCATIMFLFINFPLYSLTTPDSCTQECYLAVPVSTQAAVKMEVPALPGKHRESSREPMGLRPMNALESMPEVWKNQPRCRKRVMAAGPLAVPRKQNLACACICQRMPPSRCRDSKRPRCRSST